MKEFDCDIFCDRVISLFGDVGQVELSQKIGISQGVISAIKNKKAKAPASDTVFKIAQHFNVSADWLLGLSDIKTTDKATKDLCATLGLSDGTINFLSGKMFCSDELKEAYAFDAHVACSVIDILVKELYRQKPNLIIPLYRFFEALNLPDTSGIIIDNDKIMLYDDSTGEREHFELSKAPNIEASYSYRDMEVSLSTKEIHEYIAFKSLEIEKAFAPGGYRHET